MATIDQIKTQLQNANTLGLTNLATKGVDTTNLDTTYKIMEAIASITGGGSGSGGPSFVPLDEGGSGFYWNGDTTGITDVVTVMEEEDTNIAFYKVLAIGENEEPDSKMYYDFIFSIGAEEDLFRVIPTVTSKDNAIWSMEEGTPLMAYIVDTTEEVNGMTFPAKGLYFIKVTMSEGGETASIHVTVAISGAMLQFIYKEKDSNDKITITWDEDTSNPVLDMDGTLLYIASVQLMPCTLIGGDNGGTMLSYEVTLSDNTTQSVFPIVYFSDEYNMIVFTTDGETPVVISAFTPNAGIGKLTVPYVGTYFATGYKAITASEDNK